MLWLSIKNEGLYALPSQDSDKSWSFALKLVSIIIIIGTFCCLHFYVIKARELI